MTTPLILREDHNGVALLTIANPPVNALGLALRRELADLVAALENDDSIRAVVLTGAGASFPHGVDPEDENIRISPTFPTEEELQKAMDVFVCAAKLAAAEQALAK